MWMWWCRFPRMCGSSKEMGRLMQPRGKRSARYTRRHWACGRCGRTGLILVHQEDTPEKQAWRRAQSHSAQVRRDRCSGRGLRWWTRSQELDKDGDELWTDGW